MNNAYTRYEYGPNFVRSYATVNNIADEAYSLQVFDGAGRVIAGARNHPGSSGGYSGQLIVYDNMGRVSKQSNPAETSLSTVSLTMPVYPYNWQPAGDDDPNNGGAGWIDSSQTYDWKGRPRVTTNTDGTTKSASYGGCGCAGGEVVTLTDEGTLVNSQPQHRQQRIYSDVVGRTAKTEVLNWDSTVYATTVNSYNARDQVTQVRQYQGTDQSGVYQDTTMSYDGYGRLQTKHVPEQQVDPNNSSSTDHTTWAYNPDETIHSVTDARGASVTYGYVGNNRRLVTSISYNAPSGITTTSNVSFGYDAVGNRTSMTDGLGSKSYNYNQLSQLMSETRTITSVGTFTLSYDYNLAGELKKISDPANATINYGFDSVGRLNSVTGADNLFAGVSTYASNFQYRAFDAVKGLTYGNSKTLSVSYDNRLQASSFEVPGILKKSYQRNNDSSLQFTQDQLIANSKFDRSYSYDYLGRVSTALSGAEARGQGTTDDRPYNEAFTYDAMDHMTSRDLRHWDRSDSTGTQTYVNNRNPSWSYDADGRLTSGSTGTYIYDVAGTISSFGDSDPNMTDQQFDGDGQRVKSVQRSYNDQTNQWVTDSVTYYLNSTVLGGQVVTELSGQGTKQRTYVYSGQTVLAWQSVAVNGSQSVAWEHRDASGASFRMTDASGQGAGEPAELDPVGADGGLFKPLVWNPPDSTGKLVTFRGFEDMDMAGGGCEVDRVPIPCGMVTAGNSMACPNNECSRYNPNLRNGQGGMEDFHAYADGRAFYLAAGWTWTGNEFLGPGGMTVSFIDNHVPAGLGKEYNHALPQKPPGCTFNINISGLSGQNLTDAQTEIRRIFQSGGVALDVTFNPSLNNNPASNSTNLFVVQAFTGEAAKAIVAQGGGSPSRGDILGVTPLFNSNNSYVNQANIRAGTAGLKGLGASIGTMVGRVGAHELIEHRLLGNPSEGTLRDITSSKMSWQELHAGSSTRFNLNLLAAESLLKRCR